jgi:hypothetical protein
MLPVINIEKTTAVATAFLNFGGGRMNYMKLLKLMYLVEREALIKKGYLVTRDRPYSMKHGPVLSNTLDLLKCNSAFNSEYWDLHIKKNNYDSILVKIPANFELSIFEEKLIKVIFNEHESKSHFELRDWLHINCPEWKETTSSIPIDYTEILRLSYDEETTHKILNDIESTYFIESFK